MEKEIDLTSLKADIAKICLKHTNLNAMNQRRVQRLFEKISTTDIDEMSKISGWIAKIEKIIEENEKISADSALKDDIISKELPSWHSRRMSSYEIGNVIDQVTTYGSWGKSAVTALRAYTNERSAKRRAQRFEEQRKQREAARAAEEARRELEDARREVARKRPTSSQPTSVIEEDKPKVHREPVIPVSSIENSVSTSINEILDKGGYFVLSSAQRKAIREAVGFHYEDRVEEALSKGTNLLLLKKKFEDYKKSKLNPFKSTYYVPSLDDVCKAASYVIDVLPPELLAPSQSKEARLANNLIANINPDKLLENYATIYQIYSEYFSKLPAEEQEKVKKNFEDKLKERYPELKLSRFEIPSPDKITNIVNSRVSKEMIEHRDRYIDEKGQSTVLSILKATKYMDSEQIASIYNQIKHDEQKYRYTYNDGYDEQRARARAERDENLQYNFARAILAKSVDRKLTPKEESELLTNICKEYFHEEPAESLVDVELIEQRKQIMVGKPQEGRVFGVEKMRRVFNKAKQVYGKYAKYDELQVMVVDHNENVAEGKKSSK